MKNLKTFDLFESQALPNLTLVTLTGDTPGEEFELPKNFTVSMSTCSERECEMQDIYIAENEEEIIMDLFGGDQNGTNIYKGNGVSKVATYMSPSDVEALLSEYTPIDAEGEEIEDATITIA